MRCEYPNLPLIEERSKITLALAKELPYDADALFECKVFRQTWPNTAGGFSKPDCMAGQAFTNQYTTVMHEHKTNNYLIFFGNEYAYRVYTPTSRFYEDLARCQMANSGDAKNRY